MERKKHCQKQKAIEIIDMYYTNDIENVLYGIDKRQAISCALIFVNNILDFNNHLMHTFEKHSWWNKVRIEIIKQCEECNLIIK